MRWHPINEDVLASCSFDHKVRLYDLSLNTSAPNKVLSFHKERVRSLSWNSEIPWMLITASDDNMVAIWDVRTFKVIA